MNPTFSLVMPYHSAPVMLRRHGSEWYELSHMRSLAELVEVVICDDASPEPIRPFNFSADDDPRVRLFRIEPPHIRWSHRCATNVAASHARGEWLLITDIDHVVPVGTWMLLAAMHADGRLREGVVYTFERENADGTPYKPHPDSWLIHRKMWEQMGGYDTRYRGLYGQNQPFKERVAAHARVQSLPLHLIRYSRGDVADASMPEEFGRKCEADRQGIAKLRSQFLADGTFLKPGEVVPHVQVYP